MFWDELFEAAEKLETSEPSLSGLLQKSIYNYADLGSSIACIISSDFKGSIDFGTWFSLLVDLTEEQFGSCSGNLADVSELDLKGIVLREAAVEDVLHAFLFHKGFRAMQAYRFAHMLWSKGRTHMAIAVKARANEVYVCDIHPSAYIGPGTTIESSCCVVVGYDVKVGKDCFLGHGCSVMGCSVGDSVSIGANACISGSVTIGSRAEISACTVVMSNVGANAFVSASASNSSSSAERPLPRMQAAPPLLSASKRRNSVGPAPSPSPSVRNSISTTLSSIGSRAPGPRDSVIVRGLLPPKYELTKEEIREEILQRQTTAKEKIAEDLRDKQRHASGVYVRSAADSSATNASEFVKKDKAADYRNPKTDPEVLSRVTELKERRNREREEMKRLIQERRKSVRSEPADDSEAYMIPLSKEEGEDNDDYTSESAQERLEPPQTPLASLNDVDDETLQLFYHYYDKVKESVLEGSSGAVTMPTKAELMNFVLHRNDEG